MGRPHSLSRADWAFCCRVTSDLSAQETAGLGFMSGGITGVVTTPIDVVRTQMVLSGGTTSPLSFGTAAVNMVRSKGLRSLFRGGAMRSLEIALGGAVFFSVLQAATELIQGVPTNEGHSAPDTVVPPPAV
jgi:solute carrier family 25 S-adenosylmethionine transporter 26